MIANALLYICINIVGIFIHNVTERAQRKIFSDTRNCIAARLEIADENEKLVSSLILVYYLEKVSVNDQTYLIRCIGYNFGTSVDSSLRRVHGYPLWDCPLQLAPSICTHEIIDLVVVLQRL